MEQQQTTKPTCPEPSNAIYFVKRQENRVDAATGYCKLPTVHDRKLTNLT